MILSYLFMVLCSLLCVAGILFIGMFVLTIMFSVSMLLIFGVGIFITQIQSVMKSLKRKRAKHQKINHKSETK